MKDFTKGWPSVCLGSVAGAALGAASFFAIEALMPQGAAAGVDGVSERIVELCMPAADFAGCVQTLQRGLDPKRQGDVAEGLRVWTRDNGQVVRMRVATSSQ